MNNILKQFLIDYNTSNSYDITDDGLNGLQSLQSLHPICTMFICLYIKHKQFDHPYCCKTLHQYQTV